MLKRLLGFWRRLSGLRRISVAILGATGLVGQRFVKLLSSHPFFEIKVLTASERSAGKKYKEAAHWLLGGDPPEPASEMIVQETRVEALSDVELVFSSLPSEAALKVEPMLAEQGFKIVSTASAFRMDPLVPMIIPEVNPGHVSMIERQREEKRWKGFLVTKSNCTTMPLVISLKPILDVFGLRRVVTVSLQALSGAGYPGVQSLDIVDNVIPFIKGEEEKLQAETVKILGEPFRPLNIPVLASVNRVPTLDGHLLHVFAELEKDFEPEEVKRVLREFKPLPQRMGLYSAPDPVIQVREEEDRPQPRLDRDYKGGMGVVVGRVSKCNSLTVKYAVLSHNTVRGAAGGSILVAELLREMRLV
ncbi:MAG: aspartate-semialdehyde dehydrogenase [Candidatus Brockarchaeota archaeon]|nr:aspartate-semialdehyde dehydrogenase [Candidatus Brockarchaeota archaeon]